MSQQLPSHIYSVMISLAETSLILPNSAVVDVMGMDGLIKGDKGPEWLLGQAHLQHLDVPVISLEAMLGQPVPELTRKCRLVVLNAPMQPVAFAVLSQAYPLIVTLNEVALKAVEMDEGPARKLIFSKVQVANRTAMIPDLDALAAQVHPYSE